MTIKLVLLDPPGREPSSNLKPLPRWSSGADSFFDGHGMQAVVHGPIDRAFAVAKLCALVPWLVDHLRATRERDLKLFADVMSILPDAFPEVADDIAAEMINVLRPLPPSNHPAEGGA